MFDRLLRSLWVWSSCDWLLVLIFLHHFAVEYHRLSEVSDMRI